MTSSHGGKRKGAGRPKSTKPVVRKMITLPQHIFEMLEDMRIDIPRSTFIQELIVQHHEYLDGKTTATRKAKAMSEKSISKLFDQGAEMAYILGQQDMQQRAVEALDEKWNCNCLTDESLERTECECVGSPAAEVRELELSDYPLSELQNDGNDD